MHVVSEANLMNKCEIDLYQSATKKRGTRIIYIYIYIGGGGGGTIPKYAYSLDYFGLLWIFGYEWSLEVHCRYNSQHIFTGTATVQYEKTTSKI